MVINYMVIHSVGWKVKFIQWGSHFHFHFLCAPRQASKQTGSKVENGVILDIPRTVE